jgi:hypothetical protein
MISGKYVVDDIINAFMKLKLIVLSLLFANVVLSQNFNYSFSQSSSTYQSITNGTILSAGDSISNLDKKVALGFSFNYAGANFDSVFVAANGYLIFDDNANYGFALFAHLITAGTDSSTSGPNVSYLLSGSAGNRIFKIQYNDCSFSDLTARGHFNCQVWLYESDSRIEIRNGDKTFSSESNEIMLMTGLINMNYSGTGILGQLLTGSVSSPLFQTFTQRGDNMLLNNFSSPNSICVFSPAN